MKLKIFIIGMLALCGISASAAENYFRPGTVWTTRNSTPDPNIESSWVYYTILDEIMFEGEKVLPLVESIDTDRFGNETEPGLVRYLRVDGDKVYWRSIQPDYPNWYLLYDFGLQVGEKTTVYSLNSTIDHENEGHWIEKAVPMPLECIRYDYYLNDNPLQGPLMRLKIPDVPFSNEEYYQGDWIIGMGPRSGSASLLYPGSFGMEGVCSTILCVESPKGNVVYGSPVAGIKTVSDSSMPEVKAGVFNMQGIRVADSTDNLPAGLYIVDGKKVAITK